jgi:hypothetical protein
MPYHPSDFDLQLFSAGAQEDVDVGEEEDLGGGGPPEDETVEAKAARLETELGAANEKLTAFDGVIQELRSRPQVTERIIERERQPDAPGISKEERDERNARLAMALATNPDEVLAEVANRAEGRAADRIIGEVGDVAADAIIDRFLRKASEANPILAPKIEPIFRKAIDEMGPRAKAALLRVPAEQREVLLQKEYKAAAGDYLMPLARPKVKPGAGTDAGGRGAGTMPEFAPQAGGPFDRQGKFHFPPQQRDALRARGWDEAKIKKQEEAISAGLA